MQEADKQKFAAIMKALAEVYEMDFNPTKLGVWFEALSDLDIKQVAKAVSLYIKSPDFGGYKPKPADIIKMAEGTAPEHAAIAWDKTIKAISAVGRYQSVVFDDPLIHKTIELLGGWIDLCATESDSLKYVRKDFEKIYTNYRARKEVPDCRNILPGITECENSRKGYDAPNPVLIGDAKKAMMVFESKSKSFLMITEI